MQRCSEKAFAKCPTRHLCGTRDEATFTDDSECAAFNQEIENRPTTNADHIRAMSDEELAQYLDEKVTRCPFPSASDMCTELGGCKACILNWLRQPAECASLSCCNAGIVIKPDGIHELSPHKFQEEMKLKNVTVQILRCKDCGEVSIGWYRQTNTEILETGK